MAFQNHEGQVRSFQMPAYFWYRRAERSREEGQPVRALSLLRMRRRRSRMSGNGCWNTPGSSPGFPAMRPATGNVWICWPAGPPLFPPSGF